MNRWEIGDVKISRFVELEVPWKGTMLLPKGTEDNVRKEADWLCPHFATKDGLLNMSIHALVVESKGKRIIVDTCIGNDKKRGMPAWNEMHTSFLSDLEKAGYPRESFDTVVCTHLHVDHVGWNTMLVNGKWVPTFDRARYLIAKKEWEHWSKVENPFGRDPVEDSVRPIINAGLADLVEPTHKINDEVWFESTPGHTPGHFSVRISSGGKDAVITGDLMHHPIQCRYPEWDNDFDNDGAAAKKTRRAFIERYADKPVLVIGTHFAAPTAGFIKRKGDSFRFVP